MKRDLLIEFLLFYHVLLVHCPSNYDIFFMLNHRKHIDMPTLKLYDTKYNMKGLQVHQ